MLKITIKKFMKNLTNILMLFAFSTILLSCNNDDDDFVQNESVENANIIQNSNLVISDTVKKITTKNATGVITNLNTDEDDDGDKKKPCHQWECMRID